MQVPQFVIEQIKRGRSYIGASEDPDYRCDPQVRYWEVTRRTECFEDHIYQVFYHTGLRQIEMYLALDAQTGQVYVNSTAAQARRG